MQNNVGERLLSCLFNYDKIDKKITVQRGTVLSADWSGDSILQTPMIAKSTSSFNDLT